MSKDYITKTPGARVGGKNEGGKFINLLVDGNFKLVFSNPEHIPELIGILNEFIPDVTITELTLTQQEQRGRRPEQKSSVFDMECVVDGGRKIVVEVQFNSRPDYLNRMLYYSTWPISNQHLKGDNNYSLNDVYIISFCNFALLHDVPLQELRSTGHGSQTHGGRYCGQAFRHCCISSHHIFIDIYICWRKIFSH